MNIAHPYVWAIFIKGFIAMPTSSCSYFEGLAFLGRICSGALCVRKICFTFQHCWWKVSKSWGKWECLYDEICTSCWVSCDQKILQVKANKNLSTPSCAGSSRPPRRETSVGGCPAKRLVWLAGEKNYHFYCNLIKLFGGSDAKCFSSWRTDDLSILSSARKSHQIIKKQD